MENPKENDKVVCPISGEKQKPEKVWFAKKPDGSRVKYGIIRTHHHGSSGWGMKNGHVCEWSGLAVPVEMG